MRHLKLWPGMLALLMIALAACAAPTVEQVPTAAPTSPATATALAAVVAGKSAAATELAASTLAATASAPTEAPTTAPTETAAPTEVVNYCVECHTDKDQLISTAKPEEVVEKESEGAG